MSVTTTSNTAYYTTVQTLRDYDLMHTGPENDSASSGGVEDITKLSSDSSQQQEQQSNPPGWTTDHRRVPNYRPIRHNTEVFEAGQLQHPAERTFIWVMLHGVGINAVGLFQPCLLLPCLRRVW